MHLDTSIDALWKEITNAEEARDAHLATFERQVQSYTGPYYSAKQLRGGDGMLDGESSYDPSNFNFQIIAWMLPQLVYNNPKWVVKANKVGPTEALAKAYKHGLDRWSRDEKLSEKLQMVAVDFMQNYGVMVLSCEDHPTVKQQTGKHKGEPARRPCLERIPQDRYFHDVQASSKAEMAFEGHSWLTTRKDLLERAEDRHEEGWNVDAINALHEGANLDSQFKHRSNDFWDIERKQIAIYEMWVKDHEDDDHPGSDEGFFGTIFTLALDQRDGVEPTPHQLRKPRPYYGSPNGPYHVADVYPVSNETHRLAPLIAIEGQVRALNRLTRAVDKSAGAYKRLILVNTTHEELGDIIAGAEHDYVIPLPGLDKSEVVSNLEVGGITQEMLASEQRAKELVERASGYTEAAQGQVSGNSTATEANLVNQNSNTRMSFPLLRFHQFVAGIGEDVARYFWYEEEIQFALGAEASGDMEIPEGAELWFTGGDHDPENGRTFADLDFDIEPMSMGQVTEAEQQQKALTTLGLVERLATLAAQAPWADVKRLAGDIGNAVNITELGDYIDANLAAQVGLQGQVDGSPHPEQPKLQTGPPGVGSGIQGGKRAPNPRANQMLKSPQVRQASTPNVQPQGVTQ